MRATVRIVSAEQSFAELLRDKLRGWGLDTSPVTGDLEGLLTAADQSQLDVLLLDIRQQADHQLRQLTNLKEKLPGLEVVLINTPEGIGASMEGMRSGAADELTTPIDADVLREKIQAAVRRRRQNIKAAARKKRSLWGIFERSMAAATFAQAGDFDTALEFAEDRDNEEQAD